MISFAVPAYNEERYLPATLAAIHAAARALREPYEIVVADDASTDATAAIAREHGARWVAVDKRQIAATRNAAARASTGELLVFVDADTIVDAGVVRAAVAALRAGAVGGGARVRVEPLPLRGGLFMAIFSALYFGLARLAAGCFLFCTRAAFEAAGGFDEGFYAGEEIELSRALKRLGRFVILREKVASSARKLERHSVGEIAWMFVRLAIAGRSALRTRERTTFWYPDRR